MFLRPPNPFFTGREELLTELHHRFQEGQTAPYPSSALPLALTGLCGIGKTAIAREFVYQSLLKYQATMWLNASSRDLLSAEISRLAPFNDHGSEEQVFAHFKSFLHELPQFWLLVLDQIDDITLLDLIIPVIRHGHVLLTTRVQAPSIRAIDVLPVLPLSIDASAFFLLRRTGLLDESSSPDVADVHQARMIAQELDGLPLALDQAGAYLKETGGSLDQLLDTCRHHPKTLLGRRGQLVDVSHPDSLMATLERICQRLTPSALELLRLFAYCPSDALPDELLSSGLNQQLRSLAANIRKMDGARIELIACSLIQSHRGKISMYPLIQSLIRETLTTRQQHAYERMAGCIEL